jgi:hypothetical protein
MRYRCSRVLNLPMARAVEALSCLAVRASPGIGGRTRLRHLFLHHSSSVFRNIEGAPVYLDPAQRTRNTLAGPEFRVAGEVLKIEGAEWGRPSGLSANALA